MSRALIVGAACALLVGTSGCGREMAFAQTLRDRSVRGQYVYAGKGSTATIPWKFDAVLKLDGRGRYDLDVTVDVKDDHDQDNDQGSYRVDGDRLFLDPEKHGEKHELLIRGDSLVADVGWKGSAVLALVGVPKPVFVKR
ncbi:MAG: hypothetical protein U0132_00685 [Gemmatimonadaceae bacterium]